MKGATLKLMIQIWISFLLLHIFVLFGWLSKIIFKRQINEKGFVLISIYFLQPLLIFWGILIRPIDWTLFLVPFIYLLALMMVMIIALPLRFITSDSKQKAILQITGLVSNTGNLGIPFGLLLYGPASVPYTAMINLINSIFVTSYGAYRYSRGTFSVRESLINIIKLPMIWAALFAIIWQLSGVKFPSLFLKPLEMAAYSTMVIQLMIFGMFVASIKWQDLEFKNIAIVQITKYALLPLAILMIHYLIEIPNLAMQCLTLQALMPIAVNNMNLAALYDCYPQKVAIHAIISSIIALFLVPFLV